MCPGSIRTLPGLHRGMLALATPSNGVAKHGQPPARTRPQRWWAAVATSCRVLWSHRSGRCQPPLDAGEVGRGCRLLRRPVSAFHQARGFNLITCFICANLFFNQSCSARRKEAPVGSFAPSCSKREVNGSYPCRRSLWSCGPGPPFAGAAQPGAWEGFSHLCPQHRATSPQVGCRAAWALPEDVFETRCLVRRQPENTPVPEQVPLLSPAEQTGHRPSPRLPQELMELGLSCGDKSCQHLFPGHIMGTNRSEANCPDPMGR